jgi:hypothetical protein
MSPREFTAYAVLSSMTYSDTTSSWSAPCNRVAFHSVASSGVTVMVACARTVVSASATAVMCVEPRDTPVITPF